MNVPEIVWWLLVAFVQLVWHAHPLLVLVLALLVGAFLWELSYHFISLYHAIADIVFDWVHDPEWAILPSPFRHRRQRKLSADAAGCATCPANGTVPPEACASRGGCAALLGPTVMGGVIPLPDPEDTPRAADALDRTRDGEAGAA